MSDTYIINTNEAIGYMNAELDCIADKYKKYGVNVNGYLDGEILNSVTRSNAILPVKYVTMAVAAKRLFDNVQYDCVRSQDLVYCVHDIFHEERHVYQKSVLYKNKNAS